MRRRHHRQRSSASPEARNPFGDRSARGARIYVSVRESVKTSRRRDLGLLRYSVEVRAGSMRASGEARRGGLAGGPG